jgi:hairy-and-enhancer-of-split protein
MLERKRRARINKCLDELKELMVHALQHEGESITKLEKADVLELTVRHLRKLKAQGALSLGGSPAAHSERYRAGFRLCAGEITKFVTTGSAGLDLAVSARLLQHLSLCLHGLETAQQAGLLLHPGLHQHHQPSPPPTPLFATHATSPSCLGAATSPPLAGIRATPAPANGGRRDASASIRASLSPRTGEPAAMPAPRPSSAPATIVKADVTLLSVDEKAWRPW